MSPASRAEVLNTVRTRVCACSSTTDSRRFHMIWSSISAMFLRVVIVMASPDLIRGPVPAICRGTCAGTDGRDTPGHDGEQDCVSRRDLLDHDVIAGADLH